MHTLVEGFTMAVILVVEDNMSLLRFTAEHIRRYFTEAVVLEAQTVAEALELARVAPPKVAVVDHRLPDGLGQTLCGDLLEFDAETRSILMSGAPIDDPKGLPGGHRISAVIEKPFDPRQLLAALAAVVIALEARKKQTNGGATKPQAVRRTTTGTSWRRLTERSSKHRLVNRVTMAILALRTLEWDLKDAMAKSDNHADEIITEGIQELVEPLEGISVSLKTMGKIA